MAINAHYNVAPSGVAGLCGGNAIQTVTVARHYPKNPQQAVGYKGIVDYTRGVQTSDITLDCILTEDSNIAVPASGVMLGTSVYYHAEAANCKTVSAKSYYLTSCAISFPVGNPATVNYGWITYGEAADLITQDPALLTDGEEAAFAVVMGDDGSGIVVGGTLESGSPALTEVLPSGVQNLTFNSTINKNQILDVRSVTPIEFVTTYPIDITGSVETYVTNADLDILSSLTVNLNGGTLHTVRKTSKTSLLVSAKGMVKTDCTQSVNVGGYLTYTYNYLLADLSIPLT
jgi:hypothetical protein